MPFSAWIWAALAEAGRHPTEAPPGRVARARFSAAASWFKNLLEGRVMPLQRTIWPEYPSLPQDDARQPTSVTDASPWGSGGVL
eukprot:1187553-Amphidinium_carterae.1